MRLSPSSNKGVRSGSPQPRRPSRYSLARSPRFRAGFAGRFRLRILATRTARPDCSTVLTGGDGRAVLASVAPTRPAWNAFAGHCDGPAGVDHPHGHGLHADLTP